MNYKNGLCQILHFPNTRMQILNFQDLDYLNIEFSRFGQCQILNFQGSDYVKYNIFKIWTMPNTEFSRFELYQTLNFQDLNFVKY